jgi:hypothetical protein
MSKHTPGPWFRDKYGAMIDCNGGSVLLRGFSTLCSGSDDRTDMAEANPDLACAAPDLLEALEMARCHVSISGTGEELAKVEGAIAKAKGETK